MSDFYSNQFAKVVLDKKRRNEIWKDFKKRRVLPQINLKKDCPALLWELQKSIRTGNHVQSAIFSECVYAQTLANIFKLEEFEIYGENQSCLSADVVRLLSTYDLRPRYVYHALNGSRVLVQAGGPGGVDGALIEIRGLNIFTIEFKESSAKTSEPDLPKYGEDGMLRTTSDFLFKYPQFGPMVEEQINKNLNFFERAGTNIGDFSSQSIGFAVTSNYARKKFADVICTEDESGYLTMIPANQIVLWAETKGEIRPAGRNKYSVWTPSALKNQIQKIGGSIDRDQVSVLEKNLITSSARGGNGEIHRYKLSPLFFVYAKDVQVINDQVIFNLRDIMQLNPTVSAHMHFTGLKVRQVKDHYGKDF